MKPYEKNLRAFVKLIESRELTALEQTELLQLVQQSENYPENDWEQLLANAIIQWCQSASLETVLANYRRTLLPATSVELKLSDQPISIEAGKQACLDLLRNAIQTSGPPKHVSTPTTDKPGEVPKVSEKKP
jgi:hypothetical protein